MHEGVYITCKDMALVFTVTTVASVSMVVISKPLEVTAVKLSRMTGMLLVIIFSWEKLN